MRDEGGAAARWADVQRGGLEYQRAVRQGDVQRRYGCRIAVHKGRSNGRGAAVAVRGRTCVDEVTPTRTATHVERRREDQLARRALERERHM